MTMDFALKNRDSNVFIWFFKNTALGCQGQCISVVQSIQTEGWICERYTQITFCMHGQNIG